MFDKNKSNITVKSKNVVGEIKNWYQDRYSTIILQRNLMAILLVLLSVGCILGVLFLRDITTNRTIKPFVIQVEDNTGITTVVDSVNTADVVTRNESIKSYFVVKYVKSRETYSEADYLENYKHIVRLFSDQDVYSTFIRSVNNEKTGRAARYASHTVTTMQVRSIQYNDSGNVATIRFRINEQGRLNGQYNKIATLKFVIVPMSISLEDRFINPIGFKVTSYRVDDEIS